MKTLIVTIEVADDVEAYQTVTRLAMEHKVIEADLDGYSEKFDKTNQPNAFLKDNSKMQKNVFKQLI